MSNETTNATRTICPFCDEQYFTSEGHACGFKMSSGTWMEPSKLIHTFGWICAKCGSCYAPHIDTCSNCHG